MVLDYSPMLHLQVGTEISFRLPISSSSSFEAMFREIESCIRRPEVDAENSTGHCIESYGISVTTLEEVFLKVAGQSIDGLDSNQHNLSDASSDMQICENYQTTPMKPSASRLCCGVAGKSFRMTCSAVARIFSLMFAAICSFIAFFIIKFCSCEMITSSTFWKHSKALLIKRAISARRDRRTIVFQLLIPAVFLLFGLLFLKLKPHPDQHSITLSTSYFNPLLTGGGGGPIPFNLSMHIAQEVFFIYDIISNAFFNCLWFSFTHRKTIISYDCYACRLRLA